MLIKPLHIEGGNFDRKPVQRNLADIKAAIKRDFGLAKTFTTQKAVLRDGAIDVEVLHEKVTSVLSDVVDYLDGDEVKGEIAREERAEKSKEGPAESGRRKRKGKAGVLGGASVQSTASEVEEIKTQLRILVVVIKTALGRDFEKRGMSDDETQDIVDRLFKDFDRRLGVVPRLSEHVTTPSYIQLTALKKGKGRLGPNDLPPQLWREMLDEKTTFGREGVREDRSEVVRAGAGAVVRKYTQRDHFQPKVDVFGRLKETVAAMEVDPQFREEMLGLDARMHDGEETYFKRGKDGEFSVTRVLDRTYNETLDNLWFLESIMNSGKSDVDPVTWILNEPSLGLSFFRDVYFEITEQEDFQERWGEDCRHWDVERRRQFMDFVGEELLDNLNYG